MSEDYLSCFSEFYLGAVKYQNDLRNILKPDTTDLWSWGTEIWILSGSSDDY